ncbi:MAG: signal peptidase I [Lachnospiraceae bacterium]|nr:signal peptidase I [Lachnospiraceae bacterium]
MARRKGLNFYKRKKKISAALMKEIWSYIFLVLASVLVAFVLVFSIGMKTSVIGVSMEPALYNGQEILVNRFVYRLFSPKSGDVVVFLPGGNQNSHYYVKRIAAEPGDTVVIREGVLYINNVPYQEVSLDKIADAGILENELILEKDEYLVIGDNINNSEDSRSGNIGPVKADSIIGKVWFHMASARNGMGFID